MKTVLDWSVDRITIEESGPVRAVEKAEGRTAGPAAMDRILRLELYAGSPVIRGFHTLVTGRFDPREYSLPRTMSEWGLAFLIFTRGLFPYQPFSMPLLSPCSPI
jgi:hypothetical protein